LLFLPGEALASAVYDAAQERGEVAGQGGNRGNQHVAKVPDGNAATDFGISRKAVHEGRR
jgi:hypothetical protein